MRARQRSRIGWRPARLLDRRIVGGILLVVAICAWFFALGPRFLGGPAGYVLVSGDSMEPAMSDHDFVLTRKGGSYDVGDVIAYEVRDGPAEGSMVIHRIVGGSDREGYVTRGDNRDRDDPWRPKPGDVLGRVWLHVPQAGAIFLRLRTPLGLAMLGGLLTVLLLARPPRRRAAPSGGTAAQSRS